MLNTKLKHIKHAYDYWPADMHFVVLLPHSLCRRETIQVPANGTFSVKKNPKAHILGR